MINEKSQIALINKRIFLVKIQAIIFVVGIVFAVYSGWAEFNDYVSSVIEVIAMPIAAFSETIYYKIYSLLLSVIIFCKIFYFTDSGIKKELFLLYILNIFPLYIIFLDVNENNLLLVYILFFISILIYIISIYKIKKFYELLNKIKL